MKKILIGLLLCASSLGFDSSDPRKMHDFAHFGGGYMVNTGAFGIWKAIMRPEDRGHAILYGILTTAIVCASKEASDWSNGGKFSGRDMAYCGLGTGASTLTILMFGF